MGQAERQGAETERARAPAQAPEENDQGYDGGCFSLPFHTCLPSNALTSVGRAGDAAPNLGYCRLGGGIDTQLSICLSTLRHLPVTLSALPAGDPAQAGPRMRRPIPPRRPHERGEGPGQRLRPEEIVLGAALLQAEGEIGDAQQLLAIHLVDDPPDAHSGLAAAQIDDDHPRRLAVFDGEAQVPAEQLLLQSRRIAGL